MKLFYSIFLLLILLGPSIGQAQSAERAAFQFRSDDSVATDTASTTATSTVDVSASATAASIINQRQNIAPNNDLTQPEELPEKTAILSLFESRPVNEPGIFNIMAYWVQEAVRVGVPANTIFLILLTPFLAFFVSFVRVVIGLPTLDMLVPIALAFALVAVGITVGLLVLAAILIASYFSKISLSKVRIMFYPKRSLSMIFLALAVFAALTLGVMLGFEQILSVSIFPILVLMLLGDMIVSVQLHKSSAETLIITGTTIFIGLVGYLTATSTTIQNVVILYPEIILLVIPANIIVGRYFGLRVLEVFRFNKVVID